jgi:plastocyanin
MNSTLQRINAAMTVVRTVALAASLLASANPRTSAVASEPAQQAAHAPAAVEVKIDNFSFAPKETTVAAGTTITWINHDDIPHTVVSTEKVFKSKVLDTDEKFSYTFSKPGTYPYFCSVHPHMTGTVVVK